MNNLPQSQTPKVFGKFQGMEKAIILAEQTESVKAMTSFKVESYISIAVIKAIRNAGQKPMSDNDVKFICSGIADWAQKVNSTIKIEELILALDLGSKGEFKDDVVFVSVKNCVRWVKAYSDKRLDVLKAHRQVIEKERRLEALKIGQDKERFYWIRFPRMVQREFLYLKKHKTLSESAYRICKGLDSIDMVAYKDIPPQEKRAMYFEENKRIEKQQQILGKAIEAQHLESEIVRKCKERCLEMWFDRMEVFDKTEINQFLTKFMSEL